MGVSKTSMENWVRQLKAERQGKNPEKGYGALDVRLAEQFAIIQRLKERYPVKQLCHVFDVHRSSHRAWRDRPKGLPLEKKRLRARIKAVHTVSRGSAGIVARQVCGQGDLSSCGPPRKPGPPKDSISFAREGK